MNRKKKISILLSVVFSAGMINVVGGVSFS